MRLVVDMNILFSFFKKDSTTRELITSFDMFELYSPLFGFKELLKNRDKICGYSRISIPEFKEVVEDLNLFVDFIPDEKFKDFGVKASKILSSHIKDAPYAALVFWFKSKGYETGLWSNEKRLGILERYGVKVHTTNELLKLFGFI
ncbi:MAG TPA: hypothetical protein DCE80_03060 [Ignavibacteriales bacterium]|nr:hypothetical protein [Candidatus Aenigmarchaeota archaeon]HAB51147.1 hypothetical protein [Ignavibacteriales bacterium]